MTTTSTPSPLDGWLAEVCPALGLDEPVDVATVLDVARDVARGVARPAAPLTTFLLGLAVGRQTGPDGPGGARLTTLARAVQDLALRHTPGDPAEH